MTDLHGWLSQRTPPAPTPLARWMDRALGKREGEAAGAPGDREGEGTTTALAETALAELGAARSAPGKVRSSAFHLLAADALLTYACEAALEEAGATEALEALLRRAAAVRP